MPLLPGLRQLPSKRFYGTLDSQTTKMMLMWIVLVLGFTLADSSSCPSVCFCNEKSHIAYCDRKGLEHIPEGIPSSTELLRLSNNHFITGTLQRKNFTSLTKVQKLYISSCGIETIEPGAFQDLKDLKWLDLTYNRIKILAPHTFRGLALDHLFLNNNPHMHITANAFKGMTTQGLYMSDCYLHRIDPRVFRPLRDTLEKLWLDNNRLKTLPESLTQSFSRLSHLRLGLNPLHCNCELKWFKTYFADNLEAFQGAALPSCNSPKSLQGVSFTNLDLESLVCRPPVLKDIEVSFEGENATIRCSAESDPAAKINLQTPDGDDHLFNPHPGAIVSEAELIVSQRVESSRGVYRCSAGNPAGNSTISLTLSWPPLPPTTIPSGIPSTTSTPSPVYIAGQGAKLPRKEDTDKTTAKTDSPEDNAESSTRCDEPKSHPSPQLQFSLLELMAAVAGSFFLAVLLSVLISCVVYKMCLMKKKEKEAEGYKYTQGTLSSAKENLYSMVSLEQKERFLMNNTPDEYNAVNRPLYDTRPIADCAVCRQTSFRT